METTVIPALIVKPEIGVQDYVAIEAPLRHAFRNKYLDRYIY